MRPGDHISCTLWDILIQQYMSNGNAPTLQRVCSCEENCRRTYTDWTAVSPETTETGVADLFYTVLFNGDLEVGGNLSFLVGGRNMMYPFMTLNDETKIVHSEMLPNGRVKVYIEKPDAEDCFHHATCYLPEYEWTEVTGFTEEEMQKYKEIVESTAHLIMDFSQHGGFENTSNF